LQTINFIERYWNLLGFSLPLEQLSIGIHPILSFKELELE